MSAQNPTAPALLAWTVEIHSMTCVVFAATRAKAKWIAVKAYWEAYGRNGWPNPICNRAECYDRSVLRHEAKHVPFSEEYVMDFGKD